MDRERKLRQLARAEKHVLEGQNHLERQRELIAELEAAGHDATQARSLLSIFERTQHAHQAHLRMLQRDLRDESPGS